jgi:hypothetical protein
MIHFFYYFFYILTVLFYNMNWYDFEEMLRREYPMGRRSADCNCKKEHGVCECKYRNARNRRNRRKRNRLRRSQKRQSKKNKSKKNNIRVSERCRRTKSAIIYLEKCIFDNPTNSDKIQEMFEKMKVLMEYNYKLTFSKGFISKYIFKCLIEFIQCKNIVNICFEYF